MDGNNPNSSELPLPQVTSEKPAHSIEQGTEQGVAPQEAKVQPGVADPAAQQSSTSTLAQVVDDQAQPAGVPIMIDPATMTVPASQSGTHDVDVIEKEWVDKAKAIVERTRNDPSLQAKELSRFKAEYLKHRFQKDIKVSDDTR